MSTTHEEGYYVLTAQVRKSENRFWLMEWNELLRDCQYWAALRAQFNGQVQRWSRSRAAGAANSLRCARANFEDAKQREQAAEDALLAFVRKSFEGTE